MIWLVFTSRAAHQTIFHQKSVSSLCLGWMSATPAAKEQMLRSYQQARPAAGARACLHSARVSDQVVGGSRGGL